MIRVGASRASLGKITIYPESSNYCRYQSYNCIQQILHNLSPPFFLKRSKSSEVSPVNFLGLGFRKIEPWIIITDFKNCFSGMQTMVTPFPFKRQDFFEKITVGHKTPSPLIYTKD
jgi:hypothetical protein